MANVYGFDPVAWSIDGGRHRAELLRVVGYASTGGGEGVISPGDCKVVQLPTAGQGVLIQTGAVAIRNRSAGARNQTYIANGRDESRLDTPAATSSSRSHLVVVRLRDPQYSPWPSVPEAERPEYRYTDPFIVPNVPSGTRSAAELNLGYSAYALARIDQPANTNNITNNHIVDLRELVSPKSMIDLASQATPYPNILPKSDTFVNWPGWNPQWRIPTWANWVSTQTVLASIGMSTQTVDGDLRSVLTFPGGQLVSGPARIDYDPGSTGGGTREVFIVTASGWLTPQAGGGILTVNTEGKIYTNSPGQIGSNESSHMSVQVIFSQRTV